MEAASENVEDHESVVDEQFDARRLRGGGDTAGKSKGKGKQKVRHRRRRSVREGQDTRQTSKVSKPTKSDAISPKQTREQDASGPSRSANMPNIYQEPFQRSGEYVPGSVDGPQGYLWRSNRIRLPIRDWPIGPQYPRYHRTPIIREVSGDSVGDFQTAIGASGAECPKSAIARLTSSEMENGQPQSSRIASARVPSTRAGTFNAKTLRPASVVTESSAARGPRSHSLQATSRQAESSRAPSVRTAGAQASHARPEALRARSSTVRSTPRSATAESSTVKSSDVRSSIGKGRAASESTAEDTAAPTKTLDTAATDPGSRSRSISRADSQAQSSGGHKPSKAVVLYRRGGGCLCCDI